MTDRQYGIGTQAGAVFVAALLLRLLFGFVIVPVFGLQTGPGSREFHTSTDGYMAVAKNLVEHGVFGFGPDAPPTVYRGPGFPMVLAAAYTLIADVGVATVLVNCVFSAATCVVILFLSASLLGRSRALWLTMPAVVFPLSIYYCASSFADTFFSFTVVLYIGLLDAMIRRPSPGRGIAHGAAFALTVLTKSILLPFACVVLVYAAARRASWFRAAALSTVVGFTLVAPWTWRNYRVSGEWVAVAVGPGFSMLSGNFMIDAGPDSDDAIRHGEARAFERVNGRHGTAYSRSSLKTAGHWDIPQDVDRLFKSEAYAMIREQPSLLPRKLLINAWRFWYFASDVPKCVGNLAVNYPTLVLAVVALVPLLRRRDPAVELLVLCTLFILLVYAMVNVSSSRYCLPTVMLLTPFAALTVGQWLARRSTPAGGGGLW
ncbi:MAG: hypothetical protein HOP29_16060, partial [Phycisphaerales bacterium]|nr:hypothetical protein [Phycisphaerales bacterium]